MSITESEKIQFYLAPMESVTGYVYRNVYHAMFGDMDKYVTPFIAPSKKKLLKTRERKDVAPEHNQVRLRLLCWRLHRRQMEPGTKPN